MMDKEILTKEDALRYLSDLDRIMSQVKLLLELYCHAENKIEEDYYIYKAKSLLETV
jgi:hypothetical protein